MPAERVITPFQSHRAAIPATLAIMISLAGIISIAIPCMTSETPEGFFSMDDMMGIYPSIILKDGDEYHVLNDLNIQASKPLYLGPGIRILFEEEVFFNLTAPPLIKGTEQEPVYLGPLHQGKNWGGINLMEADPSTPSIIMNATIEGAEIAIRSHSSDLELFDTSIHNSTRNGLDIKGPMGTGRTLVVERTTIVNSTYYGIHLLKVESTYLSGLEILECGTGIRSYRSDARMEESDILDSRQIGINSVDSSIEMDHVSLVSEGSGTSHQLLVINSSISISNGELSGANVGITALTGSVLSLEGTRIEKSYSDGIQAQNSDLDIRGSDIVTSGESALHLQLATFDAHGTTFNNNGRGTDNLAFSSIYSDRSSGKFEDCTFTGSGYAHIDAVSSSIVVGNSTLGSITNEKLVLDGGSTIEMVDTLPPSDISFLDSASAVYYVITLDVTTVEHPAMTPMAGVQVDIRDVDGTWLISSYSGPDGVSRDLPVSVYVRDQTGVYSHLPITIMSQKDGYEVTSTDIAQPADEVMMIMYPPNDSPRITLTGPVNGTKASGSVSVEGVIEDDLEVYGIKLRFDEGFYRTITVFDHLQEGHFRTEVSTGNLSGGLHTLWVHAFDGTHISTPEKRTIMVLDPRSNDTDEDGIPDKDEDKNGNGMVDIGETDPNDPDTDGDGLMDGIEIDTSDGNSTDPLDPDTDGDFLKDGFEDQNANGRVDPFETDPNNPDTDGDSVNDKDDHYPLDDKRWSDDEPSDGPIAVIIIGTIMIIILVIAIYLLIIKTRGRSQDVDNHRQPPGPRPRAPSIRNHDHEKSPLSRRR
ncbi:MAG: right-handed parallel beta-helix repeat-containing protein [Thermoplasmatota archaeon]